MQGIKHNETSFQWMAVRPSQSVHVVYSISSSGGIEILLSMANFFSDSNLKRQSMLSSRIFALFSCVASMSCHSYRKAKRLSCAQQLRRHHPPVPLTCDFFVSKSSFCSMRLIRQLAAYPRFLSVRRLCFIRTISLRVRPRSFSVRFKSRTEIDTNSSSLISGIGHGDNGACN